MLSNSRKQNAPEPKINVKTVIRVRPLNDDERARNSTTVVRADSNKRTITCKAKPYGPFDECFPPTTSQSEVFEKVVQPQVDRALGGFNCTVFAYGQTGTGKTFTMEGGRSDAESSANDPSTGMTPRAIEYIFKTLEEQGIEEFTVRVSYVELYNEELFDLLGAQGEDRERLRLFDDRAKKGAVVISGVEEIPVRSRQEVYTLLRRGAERRVTAATMMNRNSSRSHSIFTVTIVVRENNASGEELVKTGKLNLVDLAGSEHIGRSGAEGKRAKEAGNINQSLLTLGRVITALTSGAPHVPYRESKLTRMLQDSLGGSTITAIIATLSPSSCNYEETISTLEYAMRAKNIKNHPECNQTVSRKAIIKEYNNEIEKLRRDLRVAREKAGGVFLSQESYEELEKEKASLQENLLELTGQMEVKVAQLQQFIEDMSFMDEQYEAVYEMNIRFRTKLETRVSQLDDANEKLLETEHRLAAYQGAFSDMHKLAKATFGQLAITRENVNHGRRETEKWWSVEDDLEATIKENEEAMTKAVKEVKELLVPCEQKLDAIIATTKTASDKLDTCMEAAAVSSREDIQAVRGQLTSIRHLMEALLQNGAKAVRESFEKATNGVVEAEEALKKQMAELISSVDGVHSKLHGLVASVTSARSAISDANVKLQLNTKQLMEEEREQFEKEKRSREEAREAAAAENATFSGDLDTIKKEFEELVAKLGNVGQQRKQKDEERAKSLLSIDMDAFDSRVTRQEALPAVLQAFDDVAGEQLAEIDAREKELTTKLQENNKGIHDATDKATKTASVHTEAHKAYCAQSIAGIEKILGESSEAVMTSATLGSDACTRIDLTVEDTVADVSSILNEQYEAVEMDTENCNKSLGGIQNEVKELKRGWRNRSQDVEVPAREHAPLDMDVITAPPAKKERILEAHGLQKEVQKVAKTRESLLSKENIPMSPNSISKNKKARTLDEIAEESSSRFDSSLE